MKWKIFYSDGSTYSDDDGDIFDAPRQDVQAIIELDARVGWRWCSGGDYFYFDPDRGGWNSSDMIWDYLIRCKHPLVLIGRQMRDDEWSKLFARVKAEVGEKTGWLKSEDRRDS